MLRTMPTAPTQTRAMWMERVRAWRVSGLEAAAFCEGRGFAPSTLLNWSTRITRESSPRFVQVVSKVVALPEPPREASPPAPALAPVVAQPAVPTPPPVLIVEVGTARIRVERGFDAALLSEILRALATEVR